MLRNRLDRFNRFEEDRFDLFVQQITRSATTAVGLLTESVTSSDTQTALLVTNSARTEAVTAAESETGVLTVVGLLTESVTSSESETSTLVAVGLLTESAAAIDSETGASVVDRALAETVTASETEAAVMDAVGAVSETSAAGESETANYSTDVAISESVTTLESEVGTLSVDGANTESLTVSDTQSSTFDAVASLTEPLTSSDSQVSVAIFVGEASESLTATDDQSAIFVADTVISESLTAADDQTALEQDEASTVEAVTANESSVSIAEFTASLTETIEATESSQGQTTSVFDVDLIESLSASDLSVAFTTFGPTISIPLTGSGRFLWRQIPRHTYQRPTHTRSASLTDRVFAADLAITFNVTSGKVSESLNATDLQSANTVVGNSRAEFVSAGERAVSSCDFACIITESITVSDTTEAEVVPWILETIKVDGATLYVHNDSTISLDLEDGVSIDVTVSKGEMTDVLEIPICELI